MRVAVVLFNLGGPDKLESVKPFLFNLFNDKAIISLPKPLRFIIAKIISSKRDKYAREIYRNIGGSSPILKETNKQIRALNNSLKNDKKNTYKCFIAMRHWHPFAEETINKVEDWKPHKIILLPLYPQYSTTTTESSFLNWEKLIKGSKLEKIDSSKICCYYNSDIFVNSNFKILSKFLKKNNKDTRILFSAHGLPEKVIKKGDPYEYQVNLTVKNIIEKTGYDLDYILCYQSKVGPLKWLLPSTEDEIIRAGKDKKNVVLIPISFVSEHSETLYELDKEYKIIADKYNVKKYTRIPTVSIDKTFINNLSILIKNVTKKNIKQRYKIKCPHSYNRCWKNREKNNVFMG